MFNTTLHGLDCNLVWAAGHALRALTRNVPAAGRLLVAGTALVLILGTQGLATINRGQQQQAQDTWEMAQINRDNQPLQNHHDETMALIVARREEYMAMLQRRAGPTNDATVPP